MNLAPDPATLPLLSSPRELEQWLDAHGQTATEIWVRIVKKGRPGATFGLPELNESVLAYGWVDVKTKRIDDETYAIRFAPRRPKSNWTERNREIARRLIEKGRMRPEGFAKLPADFDAGR